MINTEPGSYSYHHDGADARDEATGIERKILTMTFRATATPSLSDSIESQGTGA